MRIYPSGVAVCLLVGLNLVGAAAAEEHPGQAFVGPPPEARMAAASQPVFEARPPGRAIWIASIAVLAAANVADARTSWNKGEGNRLLAGDGGNFGPRGAAIKGGVNGLWVAGQVIALRRTPKYRAMAVVNFAAAAIFGALACRNHAIAGATR